jgi:hypothetical protein
MNIGDRVKIIIKDDQFGGRIGTVIDFEKFPFAKGVDVKFSCGTVQRFDESNLRKEK